MFVAKRFFRYFDWISFFLIIFLSIIGLLFVFSATYRPEQPYSIFFKKQAFGIFGGIIIYGICSAIDYRMLLQWGSVIYCIVLGLLLFTLFKGSIGMGGQRWINMGFFKAQPSELAKILFPLFAVYYLYSRKESFTFTVYEFIPLLLTLLVSVLLILKQPDLGTALLVLISGSLLLWLASLSKEFFLYSILIMLITAPISWHFLKSYQQKRVLVFLGQGERNKERYQIEQSKIAVGSGGLLGKGFLKGTQNKLQFLPESRTDFIFSVISEEGGFIGAFALIVLFLILFSRLLLITLSINQPLIQLLAFGCIIHIIVAFIINSAMVLGLLPIVGIPMPFMSYGLSNLWITYASLGWFNNITMQHLHLSS
ncbi:MAG: rod shape-determining protein RodA [Candidatus Dependentiae bacterium]|nr:rod shape-determining protein RodA [Candidatus Dependentiae bacterium]MCL5876083.1 rod shape-determining protein RodA [Candidatus Dependentiae bacterium]